MKTNVTKTKSKKLMAASPSNKAMATRPTPKKTLKGGK